MTRNQNYWLIILTAAVIGGGLLLGARRRRAPLAVGPAPSDQMPRYRTALENGINRLYHYQRFDATHLANTVVNGVVRFTRPGDFNDPWDCQPVFSVPKERNEREALGRYMARASQKHGTTLCPNEIERRVRMLIENPLKLRAAMDELAPEMYRQLDQRYRIYCLTTKPDCPLMWAHYADHHRGICLEIDARLPDLCAAIQVQYRETYPTFRLDDDKDLTPFCTKSLDWQYEDEYRLIAEEDVGAFHHAYEDSRPILQAAPRLTDLHHNRSKGVRRDAQNNQRDPRKIGPQLIPKASYTRG